MSKALPRAAGAALYDEKMRLPNQAKLLLDLARWQESGSGALYLVCYDIDSLRKINFSYGHGVGDELLQRIAEWARRLSEGTLYRIEGDMFCLLLHGKSLAQVQQFVNSAVYRSQGPWRVNTADGPRDIFVTAHLAIIPVDDYVLAQNLTDVMERILDAARRTRGVALFSKETDEIEQERILLEVELKNCILHDMAQFSLAFQPIVNPATGVWVGVEALCRWRRGDGRQIPPLIFVPEVERLGLMRILGLWVLEEAVRTCRDLQLEALEGFFLSVNVSASQLQADFAPKVKTLLARHSFPPHRLNLEITESAEMAFNDTTRAIFHELRELGVTFALDDFGTGYSSFSNMKHLPARYVKTEREFILDIEKDNYYQYSLYVIAETAHASNMKLIVEGVETQEVLRHAIKNGADLIQGYYYSQPLDRDALGRRRARFTTPLPCEARGEAENRFNFARWLKSREAYSITPGLFGLLDQCLGLLLNGEDSDCAIEDILGAVGRYFRLKRCFVFLRASGTVFDSRYEWCTEGVEARKALFQGIDVGPDGFYQLLHDEPVIITTCDQLPGCLLERLAASGQAGGVQSLVVQPIKGKGEVLGLVGFDDEKCREWLPEEMLVLHNLCLLVLMKLNLWGKPDNQNI